MICLSCSDIHPWDYAYERLNNGEETLPCEKCQGHVKPNTISFGQTLDPRVLDQAIAHVDQCAMMLALGSSLVVEPAASMPRMVKQRDAILVIITQSETPLDYLADLKIEDSIGEVLSKAVVTA